MKKMKCLLCALVAAYCGLTTAAQTVADSTANVSTHLRIMTYNVHNAVGTDGHRDAARLGRVIAAQQPDFVCVQEVDSVTRRSQGTYVLGQIAAASGFIPTFAPAIDFDGGKYGIGLLSRTAPLSVRCTPLPGREEKRVMLVAEFADCVVTCVHLSLTDEDRLSSWPIILTEAARWNKPFILAGDWNATPASSLLALVQRDFRMANHVEQPTFPATSPDSCIDYVALYRPTSAHVRCQMAAVIEESVASDHRPVVVQLYFMDKTGRK